MSSPTYTTRSYQIGSKYYLEVVFQGAVSAGAAFPGTPITTLLPGKMKVMISVSSATTMQMTIIYYNGTTQTGYLNSGNELSANALYYYKFAASPGAQIQFTASANTTVTLYVLFESG